MMKMVHIARTASGYVVVDATGASRESASFAPASEVRSEPELRVVLRKLGLTERAIDGAVLEVNQTGQAEVSLAV
jgi:hypothetical protein